MKTARTIIVIPCYQEASRLQPECFSRFLESWQDVGFIFVNDNSTDLTGTKINELANLYPDRIASLHNTVNLGKAGSVRRGVLAAQGYEYIGYWDADLSTPLELIPQFVSVLEQRKACLVMGSRIRIAGHEVKRKAWRHYPGRIFAALASIIINEDIYDTQCGAKLFTADVAQQCFTEPFLSRWCFDVELIIRVIDSYQLTDINTSRSRLIELPLTHWADTTDTRLRPFDVLRMARDLWRIRRHYRRSCSTTH